MATSTLTATASKRIQSELREWANPPEGCLLESYEPLTTWTILMQGPDGQRDMPRLYEGQLYRLKVKFGDRYPLESPEVTFVPPDVPVHPHIYSNGHICLNILYDGSNGGWSPALTVSRLCLSLRSMLASNSDNNRPPGDLDYVKRVGNRSPKQTPWMFEDDTV